MRRCLRLCSVQHVLVVPAKGRHTGCHQGLAAAQPAQRRPAEARAAPSAPWAALLRLPAWLAHTPCCTHLASSSRPCSKISNSQKTVPTSVEFVVRTRSGQGSWQGVSECLPECRRSMAQHKLPLATAENLLLGLARRSSRCRAAWHPGCRPHARGPLRRAARRTLLAW